MKDLLVQKIRVFIHTHCVPIKPILIGYSGGADSKALLYLLLESCRDYKIPLHVAHVDHGWRKESKEEAMALEEEVIGLNLPWHLCTLHSSQFLQGNLEDQGREKRLDFFSSVYQKLSCQALFLGHHADDQAEVVLKRLLEGASLYALGGLHPDVQLRSMRILRPLLPVLKKELQSWLHKKRLSYFEDPTNASAEFLRGRMRTTLLPFLDTAFGKRVSQNLCALGEEARQLRDFFSIMHDSVLKKIASSHSLDLRDSPPLHPVQLKYLIREWLASYHLRVPRLILEGVVEALVTSGRKKVFSTKNIELNVFRSVVHLNIKLKN